MIPILQMGEHNVDPLQQDEERTSSFSGIRIASRSNFSHRWQINLRLNIDIPHFTNRSDVSVSACASMTCSIVDCCAVSLSDNCRVRLVSEAPQAFV